jgi:hypothetical protein
MVWSMKRLHQTQPSNGFKCQRCRPCTFSLSAPGQTRGPKHPGSLCLAPCLAAALLAEYADCFIDPGALPVEALQGADLLVTGTLGLAYPMTADAMHRSVELARSSGKCQVPAELLEVSICGAGA